VRVGDDLRAADQHPCTSSRTAVGLCKGPAERGRSGASRAACWGGVNGKRKAGEHLIAHGASACGASLSMHLSRDPRVYMVASRVLTLYVKGARAC
jgi:hypothetical protein